MGSSSSNRPCSPDSPLTTVAAVNAGTLPEAFATVPATGRLLLLVPTKSYRIGDFLNGRNPAWCKRRRRVQPQARA